jgi:hypothetical protein
VIAVHGEFVRTGRAGAVALAAVSEAHVERAEDGDGGAHDCHGAFRCGPYEHVHCVVCKS